MRKALFTMLLTAAAVLSATTTATASTGTSPELLAAACGTNAPNLDPRNAVPDATNTSARQRSGSSTSIHSLHRPPPNQGVGGASNEPRSLPRPLEFSRFVW